MLDKLYYNTILSQTFSPCGTYLLAGNIYGQIAVFDLDKALNPNMEDPMHHEISSAKHIFTINEKLQINSLITTPKFLVVGTVGEITGWDWKSVTTSKPLKPIWTIKLPVQKDFVEQADVNTLWWNGESEKLFAGCGDNNIYCFNLEDGQLVRTFEGHVDYIHSLHGRDEQLISAGEDGCVKLWDQREKNAQNTIEPHKNSKLTRADLGKWIGSATIGDDWIVCGGGPRLALWHIRSLDAVTVFDLPDRGIHVSYFHDDCIIAAGAAKHLYQLNYSGEITVELPVSSTTVYSAVSCASPQKAFSIAGSSSKIDLCTTYNYRDQILYFR